LVDDVIRFPVAGEDIFEGDERAGDVPEAGRRAAFEVAAEQDDIGLIERYPVFDPFESRDHHFRVAEKLLDQCRPMPGMALHEPAGMGEVVEGYHRLDVVASQDINNFLIVRDGLFVPGVFTRLDPAPLEGKTVGIIWCEGEIFPEKL
jgi:hypothetical protein